MEDTCIYDEKVKALIEEKIGYEFDNKDLLEQAFRRKGYCLENAGKSNETLEWIGDSVLYMYITKIIIERYGYYLSEDIEFNERWDTDAFCTRKYINEGELSKLRDSFICRKRLSQAIDKLDISKYLLTGKGDVLLNLTDKPKLQEDLFESILGAVALDSDYCEDDIINVMSKMLEIDENYSWSEPEIDYVNEIQKWSQKLYHELPEYIYKKEYDQVYVTLKLPNQDKTSSYGRGHNQKDARNDAARHMYHFLTDNDMLLSIYNDIPEEITLNNSAQILNELNQKRYFENGILYTDSNEPEEYDENGNPIWSYYVQVPDYGIEVYYEDTSKKRAKQLACYDVLTQILQWKNTYNKSDDED